MIILLLGFFSDNEIWTVSSWACERHKNERNSTMRKESLEKYIFHLLVEWVEITTKIKKNLFFPTEHGQVRKFTKNWNFMRLFRHACQKIVQIVEKIQLNSLIFPRTRSVLNNFLKKIISQLRARVGCHFLFFSLSSSWTAIFGFGGGNFIFDFFQSLFPPWKCRFYNTNARKGSRNANINSNYR